MLGVQEYRSSSSSEYAVEYIQEYLQYAMSTVTTVPTRVVVVAGVNAVGVNVLTPVSSSICSMAMYLQQYSSSMAQHTEAQLLLYVLYYILTMYL